MSRPPNNEPGAANTVSVSLRSSARVIGKPLAGQQPGSVVAKTMERYNPDQPIDPAEWTALDEAERQNLVERYHRKRRIRLPNSRLHVAIHVVVENQVAIGNEIPVQTTLARLMDEGLSRHDAIHAIGSVLAGHMFDLMKGNVEGQDVNSAYYEQLKELTAEGWLSSSDDEQKKNFNRKGPANKRLERTAEKRGGSAASR